MGHGIAGSRRHTGGPALHVRRAQEEDVPALQKLVAEYWDFEGITTRDGGQIVLQLRRLLADPVRGAIFVVAGQAEQPVLLGYLIIVYVFSLEHLGPTAEVDEFYVRSEYRGAGAGHALLAAAEAESRRAGCTHISLQIGVGNSAARAFYQRRGYASRAGYEILDKDL